MNRYVAGVLGLCLAVSLALAADDAAKQGSPLLNSNSPEMNEKAPDVYRAKFTTSKGDFVIEVHRDWAPRGADRFYNLVRNGWFDDARFFRNIPNFMVQFGINGDPKLNAIWREARIQDDPVKQSNLRGYVSFAKLNEPNTRTTQVFINTKAEGNARLDGLGFAPFGRVAEGMEVVDQLYSGYGDAASRGGQGPEQGRVQAEGNAYLLKEFPKLDYIRKAEIVPAS